MKMPTVVGGYTGLLQVAATDATITAASGNTTWIVWNNQWQQTSSTMIWGGWSGQACGSSNTTSITARDLQGYGQLAGGSPDQAAQSQQYLREQQAAQQRRLEIEGEKIKARTRAQALLQEHLNEQQRLQLAEKGFFELISLQKDGSRRRYRIHRQWSGNIQQVDEHGRRIKTLCIHPRIATPVEDSMLAQKLMIEGGMEEELLRIANHS